MILTTKYPKIIYFSRIYFRATFQQINEVLLLFKVGLDHLTTFIWPLLCSRESVVLSSLSKRWLIEEGWHGVKDALESWRDDWKLTRYSAGNFLQASSLKTIDFVNSSGCEILITGCRTEFLNIRSPS